MKWKSIQAVDTNVALGHYTVVSDIAGAADKFCRQGEVHERSELGRVRVASVLRAIQAAEAPGRDIELVLETDEVLVIRANPLLLTCALSDLVHTAMERARDCTRVNLRSRATDEGVAVELEVAERRGVPCVDAPNGLSPHLFAMGELARAASLPLARATRAIASMGASLRTTYDADATRTWVLLFPYVGRRSCDSTVTRNA